MVSKKHKVDENFGSSIFIILWKCLQIIYVDGLTLNHYNNPISYKLVIMDLWPY